MKKINQSAGKSAFFTKLLLTLVLLSVNPTGLFASESISAYEQAAIDNVMAFRVSICSVADCGTALAKIDAFRKNVLSPAECEKLSYEVQLIIETFLVLEDYNYIYEADQKDERLKPLILNQVGKLDSWFLEHKDEPINKWLYCIAGDTISCSLGFIPRGEAMKRGLLIKDYYLCALKQDPHFSMALVNAGQWFTQAPAIGGGSKSKARQYFTQSLEFARNPAEKYYAAAFLSQSFFEEGKIEESTAYLNMAMAIAPESRMLDKMKRVNQAGYNYFYYIVHRPEVDKKIAKKAN